MKHSYEYPFDDYESGYDAAAWQRALKEQDSKARNAITRSQASREVRGQQRDPRYNAWGWLFLILAVFLSGMCVAYALDVYWTKQIESSFADDFNK